MELQHETQRKTSRCPKGPPITCLLCKKLWNKNGKGGRLFMFGGSRPFMAKFEAKMKALVGKEDLATLKSRFATKFGRSYICRECYMLVRQAYDDIRRIQRSVAKSVEMVATVSGGYSGVDRQDDCESGSDQDLEIECEVPRSSRRDLPPVSTRIAEKIASTKLVTINHKSPLVKLERVNLDNYYGKASQNAAIENSTSNHHSSERTVNQGLDISLERNTGYAGGSSATIPQDLQRSTLTIQDSLDYRSSFTENTQSSENLVTTAHSLKVNNSFANQLPVIDNVFGVEKITTPDDGLPTDTAPSTTSSHRKCDMVEQNTDNSKNMKDVLSNPLLLVKTPQPIQLAEVRDDNVYMCTQKSCDWMFTSKFFWENHIRHFHCSGKPFQCPFEGCDRSFTGKSKLELHVRSHTDERPFICDKCGSGFRGNQELKAHKLTHTNEKAYQCPKCDKNFKLLSSMKRHLQFHDGNLPYHCDYPGCKKAFKSRYDLKCHYRLHTGEKPYKCQEPGCGMSFRIPCQFTMHKRAHTGERPFVCPEDGCTMAYASSNTLQAHMLTHSTDRPYCCEYCGKTLKHKLMYRAHLKKHESQGENKSAREHLANDTPSTNLEDDNPDKNNLLNNGDGFESKYATRDNLQHPAFGENETQREVSGTEGHKEERIPTTENRLKKLLCPYHACGKEYEHPAGFSDHLTKAHAPVPREKMCNFCGLAFPTTPELEDHIHNFHNSSLGQQNSGFICYSERCGMRFRTQKDLTDHVSWHLGNSPYQCEFEGCSRTFLLERMYQAHVKDHENQKPFACCFEQCSDSFDSHLKVLKHSKIHYGFFKCPIDGCNKSMQTLNTARIHLLVHEKPFACFFCAKRFASSAQWLKHKLTHTGKKIYKCRACSEQFSEEESWKEHKKLHSGANQCVCEECGQLFSSLAAKKSHSCEFQYICQEEDCGKAFMDISSLRAHHSVHSKGTSLCPKCGEVYKVCAKKHECQVQIQGPEELSQIPVMPQLHPPPLPLPLPPQFQQHQYGQQHQQLTQRHLPQQLQQQQYFEDQEQHNQLEQVAELQAPSVTRQVLYNQERTYTSITSTASAEQNIHLPPTHSLTSSFSSSLSIPVKQHTMNHLISHHHSISDPNVQPQQVIMQTATLIPVSQAGNLPCPRQIGINMLPQHSKQLYNVKSDIAVPSHVSELQHYTARIGPGKAAQSLGQSIRANSETVAQEPSHYNYLVLSDRSAQQ